MSTLSDLQNQFQQLQNDKAAYSIAKGECEEKRKQALNRKNSVDGLNKILTNNFENNVSDVNSKIKNTTNDIEDGIKGGGISAKLIDKVNLKMEKKVSVDSDMANAISQMDAESFALQAYINQMNDQINQYERNIGDCNDGMWSIGIQIANEEKRIAEEKARKAAEEMARKAAEEKAKAQKAFEDAVKKLKKKGK